MKFFILTGSKDLGQELRNFIYFLFPEVSPEFSFGLFDYDTINPSEWKEAEVLITEAMHPQEYNNPVGWRTAKKSNKKALVFFIMPGKNFQVDEFFICTSLFDLKKKIASVINSSPALQKDYERIEKQYPFLTYEAKHHH